MYMCVCVYLHAPFHPPSSPVPTSRYFRSWGCAVAMGKFCGDTETLPQKQNKKTLLQKQNHVEHDLLVIFQNKHVCLGAKRMKKMAARSSVKKNVTLNNGLLLNIEQCLAFDIPKQTCLFGYQTQVRILYVWVGLYMYVCTCTCTPTMYYIYICIYIYIYIYICMCVTVYMP